MCFCAPTWLLSISCNVSGQAGTSGLRGVGKQSKLLKEGWGDDMQLQSDVLNRHYDPSPYDAFEQHVRTNLARVDESAIDFDLLEDVVNYIDQTQGSGAILVFLPGMGEILNLCDRLKGSLQCAPRPRAHMHFC